MAFGADIVVFKLVVSAGFFLVSCNWQLSPINVTRDVSFYCRSCNTAKLSRTRTEVQKQQQKKKQCQGRLLLLQSKCKGHTWTSVGVLT